MSAAAKWTKTLFGEKTEVASGTNEEPLVVFKVAFAIFQLGLRVVLAALHDDPGFGMRKKVGAFKIVAPTEWRTNSAYFVKPDELRNENENGPFEIQYARREHLVSRKPADGSKAFYLVRNYDDLPNMSVAAYRKLADKFPSLDETTFNFELTEKNLTRNDPFALILARNQKLAKQNKPLPVYAADINATLFRQAAPGLNLLNVNQQTYWKELFDAGCNGAEGVTSPYVYFGLSGTTFATHVEDMNLHSISYLHQGAPKVWFVVSAEYRKEVEALAERVLQQEDRHDCHVPLRHKHIILTPTLLTANHIPYTVIIQREGEYVCTEAGAYHCGFNCGYNIAEAVNYATAEWLEEGMRVFGGFYDPQSPTNTDVGELCVCDYRHKFLEGTNPVVRFEYFPAQDVCKILHRRQRMFCAMKKYTDTCVDLLRAGGFEPPSVDLISEALQKVRITGPGAEPNPLREPLVFGTQPALSPEKSALSSIPVRSTGRELCLTLPCCSKCGKSFSGKPEKDAHERRCSEAGVVIRPTGASSSSNEKAGSSKAAKFASVAPSAALSMGEAPSVEGCSPRPVVASRETRRRRASTPSSSSLSSSSCGSERRSSPVRKKPSVRSEAARRYDVADVARGSRENVATSALSGGEDGSLPALLRQYVTSILAESLKGAVHGAPDRSVASVPTLPARVSRGIPRSPSSSASNARITGPDDHGRYPCIYCGKRLTAKDRLAHQYTHERSYRCLVCGETFTYCQNRTRHYKDNHPGESAPSALEYDPIEPPMGGPSPAQQHRH